MGTHLFGSPCTFVSRVIPVWLLTLGPTACFYSPGRIWTRSKARWGRDWSRGHGRRFFAAAFRSRCNLIYAFKPSTKRSEVQSDDKPSPTLFAKYSCGVTCYKDTATPRLIEYKVELLSGSLKKQGLGSYIFHCFYRGSNVVVPSE